MTVKPCLTRNHARAWRQISHGTAWAARRLPNHWRSPSDAESRRHLQRRPSGLHTSGHLVGVSEQRRKTRASCLSRSPLVFASPKSRPSRRLCDDASAGPAFARRLLNRNDHGSTHDKRKKSSARPLTRPRQLAVANPGANGFIMSAAADHEL